MKSVQNDFGVEFWQVGTAMVISATSAATAIGLVARDGNNYLGWMAICGDFVKFCNKMTVAVVLSYFSFVLYLLLSQSFPPKKFRLQALFLSIEENGSSSGQRWRWLLRNDIRFWTSRLTYRYISSSYTCIWYIFPIRSCFIRSETKLSQYKVRPMM